MIKRILPPQAKDAIERLLVHRRERRLSQLSIQDAFDEIYRKGMWKQGHADSGVGSDGPLADRYIEIVLNYANANKVRSVVDAGCGDFEVGSRLAAHFERYVALDVSPVIIQANRERYADLIRGHVSFGVADLTSTILPAADLILIRQVLQHLTNAQIQRILRNLESSDWRRVLITEEVYDPRNNQRPNLDLPSHTIRTRVSLGSGVFVDKEPFSLPAKRIAYVEGTATSERPDSGLVVFELVREDVD